MLRDRLYVHDDRVMAFEHRGASIPTRASSSHHPIADMLEAELARDSSGPGSRPALS